MKEPYKVPMTLRYALGWWAAMVVLVWAPAARKANESGGNIVGILISLTIVTLISYGLARLGWRYGWFRKP